MKGLMILANGFEDVEAIATLDVLRRSQLDITLVSVSDTLDVLSQSNVYMKSDKLLTEINKEEYDFLIIPGGKAVFNVLDKLPQINELINYFVESEKLVSAICAAPHLIGKLGHLKNETFTCFPSCEGGIIGGKYLPDEGVVRSNNFITAKSMYYSIDFALAIIDHLQGEQQVEKVTNNIKGLA